MFCLDLCLSAYNNIRKYPYKPQHLRLCIGGIPGKILYRLFGEAHVTVRLV
jgi:hypothetical protein